MDTVTFKVQGSGKTPYTVYFDKTADGVKAYCNCRAGIHGKFCKHRVEILSGQPVKGLIEGTSEELELVRGWVVGTDIETILDQYNEANEAMVAAKSRVDRSKRKFSTFMFKVNERQESN